MPLSRIILLVIFTHTSFGAMRVTASLYALANRASTFTVGVMMALIALVPMLIAMRAGRWLDAVGPRRPLFVGTSLMAGGALLPALFPYEVTDVAPLLVSCTLFGTGFMLVQITVQHIVGHQAAPDRRAEAFSMLALGFSTSSLIGPVVTGHLIDTIGHRLTFAVFFVVMATAIGGLYAQRHRLAHHEGAVVASESNPMFDLLRHKEVRNVLIASSLVSMAWDMQTFMIPVYGTRIGLTASEIGYVLGSFAAATFVIRLAMPALSRTYREWQMLTFTLLIGATAFALIPFFKSFVPLVLCSFLLGIGLGAAQPNVMSLLHERSPAGRVGEALGLRTTIMNGSHVVLPLVFGAAGSVIGAGAVFWLMSLLLGSGGAGALRHQRSAGAGASPP